jgi:hypothetical protein
MIESYTMGPGSLELGAGPLVVSAQVAEFAVECTESVKKTDDQPMLSGDVKSYPDKVSHDWKATGTLQQDLGAAGVVQYSWDNVGDEVPFEFIPSTAEGRKVTGTLRLVPIKVGGKVGEDPTSTVSWVIIGTPVLAAV